METLQIDSSVNNNVLENIDLSNTTEAAVKTAASGKTDALIGKIVQAANYGALSMMISIGHRTGLFDTLSRLSPSSISVIAKEARLNERYVREWLGAMTVASIVEHDPVLGTYYFPPEHAAVLTRDAGTSNLAVMTQFISVLGDVEDQVVRCFHNGGGVPYSEFKRFHEVMAEESSLTIVAALNDFILPLIPGIKEKLERGIKVLDLGCGRGKALKLLAKTFPNSAFRGYDLSGEAIAYAKFEAERDGLTNLRYEVRDLTNFDIKEEFDFITTFDVIHDSARPDILLSGIYNILKNDGVYLMQDIRGSSHHHLNLDHPLGILNYTISTMHCMTVSLAQGGMGLGTMWGRETAVQMLADAGFKSIEMKSLEHDINNDYYIVRKDD